MAMLKVNFKNGYLGVFMSGLDRQTISAIGTGLTLTGTHRAPTIHPATRGDAVAKKKRGPDPVILALMGEEERERLLNRKSRKKPDRSPDEEIGEAGKATARRSITEKTPSAKKGKKGKASGKKGTPSIGKLMVNSGGRLQKQRAKHQTGNPRFF